MKLEKIIEKMNFNERKLMLGMKQISGRSTVEQMVKLTGLDQATIMRAALRLSEMGLIKIDEKRISKIKLTPEGQNYASFGLPERRMLQAISKSKYATVDEATNRAGLKVELKNIAITWLKRRDWINFVKKDGKTM
ncbi:MAG: hypothetical protein ACUVQM_03545, partial [Candidatus Hadarchaeaceae archaeon]